MKLADADRQQEAIKKIMAERGVPFEQAVNIYIKQQKKNDQPSMAPVVS